MTTKTHDSTEGAVAFALSLLVAVPQFLLGGYVLSKLWLWHVVSVFGVAELTVSQAISLGFIWSYVRYRTAAESDKSPLERVISQTVEHLIINGLCLLVGWIIHLIQT